MTDPMIRRRSLQTLAAVLAAIIPVNSAFTQIPVVPRAAAPISWTYADIADVFAAAPIVIRARITSAIRIKDASVAPTSARFLVDADASALIRGPEGLSPHVRYLVDVSPDSRGRLPKLKKADVLIAALPVAGRPGDIQLVAPDAQILATPALEARVRTLIASVVAPGAPPPVTGIANAFHVPGTVIGESETQIFLSTATGAPVSVSVLRRPGEATRWALALGEIIDDAAAVPVRDTLAWYRLACFLPDDLPAAGTRDLSASDGEAARADYAFVMAALRPCLRTRVPR